VEKEGLVDTSSCICSAEKVPNEVPDLQLYPRFGLWPAATAREVWAVFWELCKNGGCRRHLDIENGTCS